VSQLNLAPESPPGLEIYGKKWEFRFGPKWRELFPHAVKMFWFQKTQELKFGFKKWNLLNLEILKVSFPGNLPECPRRPKNTFGKAKSKRISIP